MSSGKSTSRSKSRKSGKIISKQVRSRKKVFSDKDLDEHTIMEFIMKINNILHRNSPYCYVGTEVQPHLNYIPIKYGNITKHFLQFIGKVYVHREIPAHRYPNGKAPFPAPTILQFSHTLERYYLLDYDIVTKSNKENFARHIGYSGTHKFAFVDIPFCARLYKDYGGVWLSFENNNCKITNWAELFIGIFLLLIEIKHTGNVFINTSTTEVIDKLVDEAAPDLDIDKCIPKKYKLYDFKLRILRAGIITHFIGTYIFKNIEPKASIYLVNEDYKATLQKLLDSYDSIINQ